MKKNLEKQIRERKIPQTNFWITLGLTAVILLMVWVASIIFGFEFPYIPSIIWLLVLTGAKILKKEIK